LPVAIAALIVAGVALYASYSYVSKPLVEVPIEAKRGLTKDARGQGKGGSAKSKRQSEPAKQEAVSKSEAPHEDSTPPE
jgi:hypothetical protein